MYFVVANDTAGKPLWRLYANNHKKVAWFGETFASTSNAKRAAESFKAGAKAARYDIYQDAAKEWRWRAWRSSDKVASSGESFTSKAVAETAAANVRDNVGGATGP